MLLLPGRRQRHCVDEKVALGRYLNALVRNKGIRVCGWNAYVMRQYVLIRATTCSAVDVSLAWRMDTRMPGIRPSFLR